LVFAAGEPLIQTSQSGFGLVADGLLRLFVSATDGRQITLRYARAGAWFGLATHLGADPYTVTAVVRTTVIRFDQTTPALVSERADLAYDFARAYSEWSIYIAMALEQALFGTVKSRVAWHLLALADDGLNSDRVQKVCLTQQALADVVGSVREVVTRVLRDFKTRGLIAVSRSTILVLDRNMLIGESLSKRR
jgi:CRP/FNR family transcriptional regulator